MAPAPPTEVKKQKKSAFSCEPCRNRKVKCGGEHPVCNRCKARKDVCVYKLAPTLSYTQKLESRIEELEKALQHANHLATGHSPRTVASASPYSSGPAGDPSSNYGAAFKGLAFDAKGSITYHGATSFFQLPPAPRPTTSHGESPVLSSAMQQVDSGKGRLVQNAWEQRALEVLSETPEPFQYLLNNHWCWIQPLFNFVYRPTFTRDMHNLGPYYSHTLLNAMLAHSVRWCRREPQIRHLLEPYDGGALFSRHARTLLFDEITSGDCKVPTVQVLLLLSAQECSKGNRTQAWVYCGMAFRLIEDMGITIDGQRYAGDVHLSDEDKEVRMRLFWSCYFWDKIISLYLGRSPTLQHSPVSPPQIIMDDSAEEEMWIPHGLTFPPGSEYPLHKARSISCFSQVCRLSVIFHEILVHIYDPVSSKTEVEVQECLFREGQAMRIWWEELPDFLKIDATSLPQHAPPSHIVTLNCLYHTFKILLYRPMLFRRTDENDKATPDPAHFKECLASATAIMAIFDLFCRTFGYSRIVLSQSYSLYTAASIFLLQIQASSSHDVNTLQRMQFCVHALYRVKDASPVIGDALALILRALTDANIDTSAMIDSLPSHRSRPSKRSSLQPQPQSQAQQQQQQNFDIDNPPPPTTLQSETTNLSSLSDFGYSPEQHFSLHDAGEAISVFDTEALEFNPEMFEAFSTLEPISATVGLL